MTNLNLKSTITVNDEQFLVEDLVNHLSKLPAEEIVAFFKNLQISVPRILRIRVLKQVLRDEVIFTRQRLATLADETNYRLSWFRKFSEYQLENYLEEFKKDDIKKDYLQQLWLTFINYLIERQVDFDVILQLVEKSKEHKVLPFDMIHYNKVLNEIFYDDVNKIDGLTPAQFRPVLYKSSTIPQIREIGLKYNVNVPKRLRKQELLNIVYEVLEEREQYSEELELVLKKKNIIQIQRFCIDNEIKASTELKKEEIIEYILRNAAETRQDYFLPTNHSAYEYEVTDFDVEEDEVEIVEKEQEFLADQMAELESKAKQVETVYVPVLDKSQLLNLLSLRKQQLESDKYTSHSNSELLGHINLGAKTLEKQDLTQEEIDEVVSKLQQLQLVEKADKQELSQLVSLRQQQLQDNVYTEETNDLIKEQIKLGLLALEKQDITQGEVDKVVEYMKDIELVVKPEEVEVNKQALINLVNERQAQLNSDNYTQDTNELLEKHIQLGLNALENQELSQEEVDQLVNELSNIVLEVKPEEKVVDKSRLVELVSQRKFDLESKQYNQLTNQKLEELLSIGHASLESDVLTQEEVDTVVHELENVELVLDVKTSHLENLINKKKEELEQENITNESRENLANLINASILKLQEQNLSQEEVDSLYEQLLNTHVEKVLVNKEKLQQLHDQRQQELEKDLEPSSKEKLEKALQVARLCLADDNATNEQVDEVYDHLNSILVEYNKSLDFTNLNEVIKAKKEELQQQDVTKDSKEELEEAISKIEKSLEENQLSQQQLDHYERYLRSLHLVKEVKQEVKEVEVKVVDKSKLALLKEEKEQELLNSNPTLESKEKLQAALSVSQLCLDDTFATQENVEEVYTHLLNTKLEEQACCQETCEDENCQVEEVCCQEEATCCKDNECCEQEVQEEVQEEVVEEEVKEEKVEEVVEKAPLLEVKHLDFNIGVEKTIFIRKGKDLRPIYAPEVIEKDGVEYKFDYWTLSTDNEEKPFEFNKPLEESITLIPVFSLVEEEIVVQPAEEVKEEVVQEVVEEPVVEEVKEETNYYIHDYVTDLEELVKTQKQFVNETENVENLYTTDSYENFENNLIASEQLLKENPDNALCRVQYNLLAASRFNLIERQKEVEVEEVVVVPVKEEVIEEPVVEEVVEEQVEIVEDALVNDIVETTEVEQPEEVEVEVVELEVEPRPFYKVLETPKEEVKETVVVEKNVVETTHIKSAETVINNYYYHGTVNTTGVAPQGPVNYNIEAPSFDNLKVNAASYDTSDRTKAVDYEQLSGEKLNDRPQDCDCLYTHKRDWLFIIFAFFVLIAIAVAIALIVYRLVVFWN